MPYEYMASSSRSFPKNLGEERRIPTSQHNHPSTSGLQNNGTQPRLNKYTFCFDWESRNMIHLMASSSSRDGRVIIEDPKDNHPEIMNDIDVEKYLPSSTDSDEDDIGHRPSTSTNRTAPMKNRISKNPAGLDFHVGENVSQRPLLKCSLCPRVFVNSYHFRKHLTGFHKQINALEALQHARSVGSKGWRSNGGKNSRKLVLKKKSKNLIPEKSNSCSPGSRGNTVQNVKESQISSSQGSNRVLRKRSNKPLRYRELSESDTDEERTAQRMSSSKRQNLGRKAPQVRINEESNRFVQRSSNLRYYDKIKRTKVCPKCKKRFASTKQLRTHQRLHNGKRYCCFYCNRPFNQSANLARHVRTIHGDPNPWKCGKCAASFEGASDLKNHAIMNHRGYDPIAIFMLNKRMGHATGHDSSDELSSENETSSDVEKEEEQKSQKRTTKETRLTRCYRQGCKKWFNSTSKLMRHMRSSHRSKDKTRAINGKKLSCEFCNTTIRHHSEFLLHRNTHLGIKPFQCPHCPMKLSHPNGLKTHCKRVHNELLPWKCKMDNDKCNQEFSTLSEYKNHAVLQHSPQQVSSAPEFAHMSELSTLSGNEPFSACSHGAEKKLDRLETHRKVNHYLHSPQNPSVRKHSTTEAIPALAKHLSKNWPDQLSRKLFSCHHCHTKYRLPHHLKSHSKAIHNELNPWKCKMDNGNCNQKFSRLTDYIRHASLEHSPEEINSVPEFAFLSQSTSRIYSGNKSSQVQASHLSSSNAQEFATKASRKIRCSRKWCNKLFNSISELQRHIRLSHRSKSDKTISSAGKRKCNLCKQTFNTNPALVLHSYIHLGIKPFSCRHCNMKYRQPQHLKIHCKVIHNEPFPWKCNMDSGNCNQEFSTVSEFKEHAVLKHTPQEFNLVPELHHFLSKSINYLGNKPLIGQTKTKNHFSSSDVQERQEVDTNKETRVRCYRKECSKLFDSMSELESHICLSQQSTNDKTLTSSGKPQHIDQCPWKCKMDNGSCTKEFPTFKEYKQHAIFEHSPEFAFQTEGNHSTSYVQEEVATEEKTIRCSARKECNKLFDSMSELESHILLSHRLDDKAPAAGERKCDICKKGFPHSSKLALHRNVHLGIKPFWCRHCPVKYGFPNQLKNHCRDVHHDLLPWKCKMDGGNCTQEFYNLGEFKKHAILKHSPEEFNTVSELEHLFK